MSQELFYIWGDSFATKPQLCIPRMKLTQWAPRFSGLCNLWRRNWAQTHSTKATLRTWSNTVAMVFCAGPDCLSGSHNWPALFVRKHSIQNTFEEDFDNFSMLIGRQPYWAVKKKKTKKSVWNTVTLRRRSNLCPPQHFSDFCSFSCSVSSTVWKVTPLGTPPYLCRLSGESFSPVWQHCFYLFSCFHFWVTVAGSYLFAITSAPFVIINTHYVSLSLLGIIPSKWFFMTGGFRNATETKEETTNR